MTGDHRATALLTDRLGGTRLDADRPEQAPQEAAAARALAAGADRDVAECRAELRGHTPRARRALVSVSVLDL